MAGASAAWAAYMRARMHSAEIDDVARASQVGTVDLASRADCAAKFRSNVQLGGLVFAGAVAGKLTATGAAAAALL